MAQKQLIKLHVECVECGKHLGVYVGEPFYIVFAGSSIEDAMVLCKECWKKGRLPKSGG